MSEQERQTRAAQSAGAAGRERHDVEFGGRGIDARMRERRRYPLRPLWPGSPARPGTGSGTPAIGLRGAPARRRADGEREAIRERESGPGA